MSDQDDLLKLQHLLDEGRITQQEYERERAWILGSGPVSDADVSPVTAQNASGTHVIGLHEIEEQEDAAKGAETARNANVASDGQGAARGQAQYGSDHAAAPDKEHQKRIPTVWKVILVAFLVWILLLASAVVYLRLRGTSSGTMSESTVGAQTMQGSETAQSAAQEIQDGASDVTYDAFVIQLETTLGTYYGSNYSITDDGKTLTISLMGEGIAADAMYVVKGADGAAAVWSELKDSMRTLAVTCFDGANAGELTRHVVLNILNDQNQSNVILSYLDGACIYDATETSDLTN